MLTGNIPHWESLTPSNGVTVLLLQVVIGGRGNLRYIAATGASAQGAEKNASTTASATSDLVLPIGETDLIVSY